MNEIGEAKAHGVKKPEDRRETLDPNLQSDSSSHHLPHVPIPSRHSSRRVIRKKSWLESFETKIGWVHMDLQQRFGALIFGSLLCLVVFEASLVLCVLMGINHVWAVMTICGISAVLSVVSCFFLIYYRSMSFYIGVFLFYLAVSLLLEGLQVYFSIQLSIFTCSILSWILFLPSFIVTFTGLSWPSIVGYVGSVAQYLGWSVYFLRTDYLKIATWVDLICSLLLQCLVTGVVIGFSTIMHERVKLLKKVVDNVERKEYDPDGYLRKNIMDKQGRSSSAFLLELKRLCFRFEEYRKYLPLTLFHFQDFDEMIMNSMQTSSKSNQNDHGDIDIGFSLKRFQKWVKSLFGGKENKISPATFGEMRGIGRVRSGSMKVSKTFGPYISGPMMNLKERQEQELDRRCERIEREKERRTKREAMIKKVGSYDFSKDNLEKIQRKRDRGIESEKEIEVREAFKGDTLKRSPSQMRSSTSSLDNNIEREGFVTSSLGSTKQNSVDGDLNSIFDVEEEMYASPNDPVDYEAVNLQYDYHYTHAFLKTEVFQPKPNFQRYYTCPNLNRNQVPAIVVNRKDSISSSLSSSDLEIKEDPEKEEKEKDTDYSIFKGNKGAMVMVSKSKSMSDVNTFMVDNIPGQSKSPSASMKGSYFGAPSQFGEESLCEQEIVKYGLIRRHVSLLLVNIVDFSLLAETIHHVNVAKLHAKYTEEVERISKTWGGHVVNIFGDKLLILFGGIVYTQHHIHRACDCALNLDYFFRSEDCWKERISVNYTIVSELVSYGNIGSKNIRRFCVIGDAVRKLYEMAKMHSRLETRILCNEICYGNTHHEFYLKLKEIMIVPKFKRYQYHHSGERNQTIPMFELLGRRSTSQSPSMDPTKTDLFNAGWEAYLDGDLVKARSLCDIYHNSPPRKTLDKDYDRLNQKIKFSSDNHRCLNVVFCAYLTNAEMKPGVFRRYFYDT